MFSLFGFKTNSKVGQMHVQINQYFQYFQFELKINGFNGFRAKLYNSVAFKPKPTNLYCPIGAKIDITDCTKQKIFPIIVLFGKLSNQFDCNFVSYLIIDFLIQIGVT
jgi:hypothetical protein